MVEDFAYVNSSTLTSANEEETGVVYNHFSTEDSVAGTSTPSTHSSIDVATDMKIHREAFLSSCTELVSPEDTASRRAESSRTWLSQACRRCCKISNWFPKMCSCLDGGSTLTAGHRTRLGSYERLGPGPTIFEFTNIMQKSRKRTEHQPDEMLDGEKQVEALRFYNDDLTWTTLIVEKNLRTIDVCQLLKLRRTVSGIAWSIVETWPELGLERTLEDHEDILDVYKEVETFASQQERRFFFREDYLKYEFFVNPKQFFPADMVVFPNAEDCGILVDAESALRSYLSRDEFNCPQVFSLVWLRGEDSSTWKKTYMLLRDRRLYVTKKTVGTLPKLPQDHEQLTLVGHLSDYVVYRITNARRCFNAPFEWAVCLRPSNNGEAEATEPGEPGLKVIAFHTEKSRVCWLTAMRLAKYGKQLRENYRAFKNKQCEQPGGDSPKDRYNSYNVSNESVRSHVAMDFTGSVGRIVEDPKEAKDIAESEGIIWRRTWRPFSRPPPGCAVVRLHGLDDGIHVLQPWFHRGLKRDIAAAIIRDHGSVDGVFLVRESKSNLGAYVLTYKYSDKVFHAQIQPVFDERCNCWLYTLDKGVTKFYDLLQLIEFYQLNAGSLPTRLTHYVQNGVPAPATRAEDGGASPSPPEARENQRFSTGKPDSGSNSASI